MNTNSDSWPRFYNFASNSRLTDSLVYALARKEAFLQHTRLQKQFSHNAANLTDLWTMMALRFILKNKLLFSPKADALNSSPSENKVVLDVQGVLNDPWSWQIALDFPNTMIYGFRLGRSLQTKSNTGEQSQQQEEQIQHQNQQQNSQKSSSGPTRERRSSIVSNNSINSEQSTHSIQSIQSVPSYIAAKYTIDHTGGCPEVEQQLHGKGAGPANYIPCVGHTLKKMPFDDNTFDIISAKSLWYFVSRDDWDLVLKELFRILKPGGCIEMVISDFIILNGSRADQFYWGRVKEGTDRLGLEQIPSAVLPHYLYNAGFKNVNRALIALPRGWGGQMGHVTDLLALYYTESIINTFANLSPDEMEHFTSMSKDSEETFSANQMSLVYATKPEM